MRFDSWCKDEILTFCSQINNYFGNRRMREKRKALGAGKLGKANATLKRTCSRETLVLAPITKWKNIVLASEKNVAQAWGGAGSSKESHGEVVPRLFNNGEGGGHGKDASGKDR